MRNKRKLCSVALVSVGMILFLMIISSAASAATLKNSSLTINETRITTSGSAENPEIYGDKIVWQDNRSGNWDIYMYDVSTKKETQITTNKSDQTNPVIYGNKIVWLDMRNGENTDEFYWGGQDVYMYDLSTKKETRITKNTMEKSPDYSFSLDIYGDKILWGVDGTFCIYEIPTHKENWISTSTASFYHVFYGNTVVWTYEMNEPEGGNLYMYNIFTQKETPVVTSNSAGRPAIYGDKIVWTDRRNEENWDVKWDIYMYNVSTQKETQITTNGSAGDPVIYGDKILWTDSRSDHPEIYMYNISTHTETHTTNTSASVQAIYGDRIVWTNWQDEKTDIYVGTLISSNPLIAAFSASPTSGNAPLNVQFTDKSTGSPTSWKWTFGDGTFSILKNPMHKYSKAGNYTVKLTVSNAAGSNTATKTNYITVVAKPVAAFSATPTSGKAPVTVTFTDKSSGIPTSWKWTFGDGTSSTAKNPKHQYLQEGSYTVKLTVTNIAGNSTATKTNYIEVTTNTRPEIYSKKS